MSCHVSFATNSDGVGRCDGPGSGCSKLEGFACTKRDDPPPPQPSAVSPTQSALLLSADGPLSLRPLCDECEPTDRPSKAKNITVVSDILLNGCMPNSACQAVPRTLTAAECLSVYCSDYPSVAVKISGNYHGTDTPRADHVNATPGAAVAWGAITAVAAMGLDIFDNSCSGAQCQRYGATDPDGGIPPPLLVAGQTPDLFMLDEVRISGNTGWQGGIGCPSPCHAPLRGQTNGDPWPGAGWLALLDTAEPETLGCMRLGTIEADRVPTRNLLNLASFGQLHALDASTALPTLDKLDEYDGDQVWQWTNPSHSGAGLLLGELPLATNPSAANHSVFLGINVRLPNNATAVELMIDRGDGKWLTTATPCQLHNQRDVAAGAWGVVSTQAQLRGGGGTARFGVKLGGAGSRMQLRRVGAGVVGAGWGRLV